MAYFLALVKNLGRVLQMMSESERLGVVVIASYICKFDCTKFCTDSD